MGTLGAVYKYRIIHMHQYGNLSQWLSFAICRNSPQQCRHTTILTVKHALLYCLTLLQSDWSHAYRLWYYHGVSLDFPGHTNFNVLVIFLTFFQCLDHFSISNLEKRSKYLLSTKMFTKETSSSGNMTVLSSLVVSLKPAPCAFFDSFGYPNRLIGTAAGCHWGYLHMVSCHFSLSQ